MSIEKGDLKATDVSILVFLELALRLGRLGEQTLIVIQVSILVFLELALRHDIERVTHIGMD